MKSKFLKILWCCAYIFSVYYLLTGLWPVIDVESFMKVTGPKNDIWLVKTVGILITPIGIVVLMALRRKMLTQEIILLAIIAACGLTFIDVYYSCNEVISPVYLIDAIVEIIFVLMWLLILIQRKNFQLKC
ncbi:MAG: hypothetical protein K2X86_18815 [Cytophagaceae bacterium]|nr:hypothetical protein [Cytophagaceae bacterium]